MIHHILVFERAGWVIAVTADTNLSLVEWWLKSVSASLHLWGTCSLSAEQMELAAHIDRVNPISVQVGMWDGLHLSEQVKGRLDQFQYGLVF